MHGIDLDSLPALYDRKVRLLVERGFATGLDRDSIDAQLFVVEARIEAITEPPAV